jgi:hypothetical protein
VYGCACCEAKTSLHYGCTECINAWKLTMVSKVFKSKVLAYSNTLRNYWWVWTPEYRRQRKGKDKGKGQGKDKGKGYKPQSGSQPEELQAAQALATSSMTGSSEDLQVRPNQYEDWLQAEHGEAARPFISTLQSERALLVDLGFPAAPIVAPTVLDSPTESWTTTLDASGNEERNLDSLD